MPHKTPYAPCLKQACEILNRIKIKKTKFKINYKYKCFKY